MTGSRVYLDHAATSWPKPDAVLAAIDQYARQCGAAAGRGSYKAAQQAGEVVDQTRQKLARLIHAESPKCISLQPGGTLALNVAIAGLVSAGDHVVTTAAEHNSVLRPLHQLQKRLSVDVTVVDCDAQGLVSTADIAQALRAETRLVAVTHASNVTGTVQPIEAIGDLLRDHPAWLLCDAAQTLGYLPIDVTGWGIDLLAAPGHKGAQGPQGTGMLYVRREVQDSIQPLIQGGTGSQSESLEMPTDYPAKLEAGNLNVAAIAGWSAGLEWIMEHDRERTSLQRLADKLDSELSSVAGITVLGSPGPLPIASVLVDGMSPSDAAAILDAEFNIQTRAGLHCAALIHRHIGSGVEGTLRISGGHPTTQQEIETACDALRAIVAELPAH